ncbi:MAG: hypothetical protein WCJ30_16250 [Deltaproteobacteria bacterium]
MDCRATLVRVFAVAALVSGCVSPQRADESAALPEVSVAVTAGDEQIPDVPAVRRPRTEALNPDVAALRAGRTVSLGTGDVVAFDGHTPPQSSATYAGGVRPATASVPTPTFGTGLWGDASRPMVVLGRRLPENRGAFQDGAPHVVPSDEGSWSSASARRLARAQAGTKPRRDVIWRRLRVTALPRSSGQRA